MKIRIVVIMTLMMLMIISVNSQECLKSSDDHAVEAVLNKQGIDYNLNTLANAKNIALKGNKYSYLSHYNEELLVIITEVNGEDAGGLPGLSVRIQAPTINEKTEAQQLILISKSIKGRIIWENLTTESMKEWKYSCSDEEVPKECIFINNNTKITAVREENNRYILELSIIGGIKSCSNGCEGYCIRSGSGNTCLTNTKIFEIESLIQNTGLAKNFDELISAYTITRNGMLPITTATTQINDEEIDWEQAMKKELLWLKSTDIVKMTNSDIETISSMMSPGMAGHNERVVYAKDKIGVARWISYQDSIAPRLIINNDCEELSVSPTITGNLVLDGVKSYSLYYAVPAVITIMLALIITAAVFYTRWNHERNKNKNKEQEKTINEELEKVKEEKSIREKTKDD